MKIGAIILARANFGRWPEKVLYPIAGKSMFEWVIIKSKQIDYDTVIVSTTKNPEDRIIVDIARKHGVAISYGPSDDRNGRCRKAIEEHQLDYIALPSPCMPFFDQWASRRTLATCYIYSGHDKYMLTSVNKNDSSNIMNRKIFFRDSIKNIDPEQITPDNICDIFYTYYWLDPAIRNRYLFGQNIAYPFQGVIANRICEFLGHFPKNHEEIITAYMEIKK